MNLVKVMLKMLGCDQNSVDVSEAILLDSEALASISGGQGLGGFSGSAVYGSPNGFGGWGTVATPEGIIVWRAFSSPNGFSIWTGQGYTSINLGVLGALGSYRPVLGGLPY
jgi:hypothetical protein